MHRLVPAGLDPLIHDHPSRLTDTAGDLYPEFLDDLAGCEADLAPLDVAFRAVAPGDVWACAWPVPWCAVIRDLPDVRWPDPLDAGVAANPVRVPPTDRPAARVACIARRGRCRSGVEGPDRDAADRDGHPASPACRNRSSASRSRATSATLVGRFVRAWAMNSPSFGAPESNAPPSEPAGPVQLRPFTMRSPFLGESQPLKTPPRVRSVKVGTVSVQAGRVAPLPLLPFRMSGSGGRNADHRCSRSRPAPAQHRWPLGRTCSVPALGDLVSGRPRRHLTSWEFADGPGPLPWG